MEETDFVLVGVPIFMILIALELFLGWRSGRKIYRFHDTVSDLGCGMSQLGIKLLSYGAILGVYAWFESNFGLVDCSIYSPWTWVFGFFAVDFLYYWWHRLSHEVNFMWAVHVVHHQSQDYNLAVALRQAWFSPMTYLPFNLILAASGVPLTVYLVLESFSLIYQFWLHTQLIDKMGPFEKVMNTPSHHRVHHGINPRYLDRNYAAVLIIWDRLFGTFAQEREPVVYGTVKPFQSWNVVFANFAHWGHMFRLSRQSRSWTERLFAWVARPEWVPKGVQGYGEPQEVHPDSFQKFDPTLTRRQIFYVATQFCMLFTLLMHMHIDPGFYVGWRTVAAVLILIVGLGAMASVMQETKRWIKIESLRIILSTAVFIAMWAGHDWFDLGGSLLVWFAGMSIVWSHSLEEFSRAA